MVQGEAREESKAFEAAEEVEEEEPMIYDDPLWRYLVEEFDENLDPPYCRKEGEAYHPNYDHNFDGEVLTIINKQTGQKFEVREKLIE